MMPTPVTGKAWVIGGGHGLGFGEGVPLLECRGPGQSPGSFEIFNILQRNTELKNI